jgi:hypothetical protein
MPVEVVSALVCDAAEVREGMLFLLGGGVTRLFRDSYPAPLGVTLAVVLEMTPAEAGVAHQVVVRIADGDGREIGSMNAALQIGGVAGLEPGEALLVPMVFALHTVGIPGPGAYDIRVEVDESGAARTLTVRAVPPPAL